MKKITILLIMCLCLFGCQKKEVISTHELEDQGITYEQIESVVIEGFYQRDVETTYVIHKDGKDAYFLEEKQGSVIVCTTATYETFLEPFIGDEGVKQISFHLDDKNIEDATAVSSITFKNYEILIHHQFPLVILNDFT